MLALLRSCKTKLAPRKLLTLLVVMELSVGHGFSIARKLTLAAALFAVAMSATPAAALSPPSRIALAGALGSDVVTIHNKRSHRKHSAKNSHRYAHKHHRRTHIVDAPFTRVETGHRYRRGVLVDAPFAFVTVGRRGRYIRAPFVDLWLPRR